VESATLELMILYVNIENLGTFTHDLMKIYDDYNLINLIKNSFNNDESSKFVKIIHCNIYNEGYRVFKRSNGLGGAVCFNTIAKDLSINPEICKLSNYIINNYDIKLVTDNSNYDSFFIFDLSKHVNSLFNNILPDKHNYISQEELKKIIIGILKFGLSLNTKNNPNHYNLTGL